jgi:hypothetical protein
MITWGGSLACGLQLLLALTLYLPLRATLSEQMEFNKWVLCLHERRVQRLWCRQWGLTHTRVSVSTSFAHVSPLWTKKKVLYNSQNKKWLFPWTALSDFSLKWKCSVYWETRINCYTLCRYGPRSRKPCDGSGGQSRCSHRGDRGFLRSQSMWDLWWILGVIQLLLRATRDSPVTIIPPT